MTEAELARAALEQVLTDNGFTRAERRRIFAEARGTWIFGDEATRKPMKLDKLHEATALASERLRLLEFRDHLGHAGGKLKVRPTGLRDQNWVRDTMDLVVNGTWNMEIDLSEHGRIVASLRTEIDNRLAEIDGKLRALGVEIAD